jgi:hypothetical protein
MSKISIEDLSNAVSLLIDDVKYLKLKSAQADKNINWCDYKSKIYDPRTRFINRREIITLLLRFGKTEEELKEVGNYKKLLCDMLQTHKYHGCFNYIQVNEWIENNDISVKPLTEELHQTKERIVKLAEERNAEFNEWKKSQPKQAILDTDEPVDL